MGQAGFTVAVIWTAGVPPDGVARCVSGLAELVPAAGTIISVTVSPGVAGLNLQLSASLYSKALLAELQARARRAGGRFVGLLQLRGAVDPTGREGELEVGDFQTAAEALRAALTAPG